VLTALSGHTHFTGWPDRTPTSPYGAYTDFLIPHIAIAAIAAALEHQRATGEGQHLDLSQLEASLYFVGTPMVEYAANGRTGARDGNRDPAMAPHGAYPCAGDDAWCTIACQDDAQWQALCRLMGRPALAGEARFTTFDARKLNEANLDGIVAAWTAPLDPYDVMRRCQEAGVPAGVVQSCEQLFADPQLSARGHFVHMDHAAMGRYASDGNCFVLSDATPMYRPSPLLGEHTEEVCREILGISASEFEALKRDGVLS
jgi:benzylsuccinate CoA-transferase BbsF subunit